MTSPRAPLLTPETFELMVGRPPVDDDLERANCQDAGNPGHLSCGVCHHNRPVFLCPPCFVARSARLHDHR